MMSYSVVRTVLNVPEKKHLTVLLRVAICKISCRNYARCVSVCQVKHRDNECLTKNMLRTIQPHNMFMKCHLTSQRSNPKENNENAANKGVLSHLVR